MTSTFWHFMLSFQSCQLVFVNLSTLYVLSRQAVHAAVFTTGKKCIFDGYKSKNPNPKKSQCHMTKTMENVLLLDEGSLNSLNPCLAL